MAMIAVLGSLMAFALAAGVALAAQALRYAVG
jgi:hypothetical protein